MKNICFAILVLIFDLYSGNLVYAQWVTHHNPVLMTNISKPARGITISDPKFGTQITKITNAINSGNLGIVPHYSKRQAWNTNESLMILLNADDGYFGLYNGQTYQYIKPLKKLSNSDCQIPCKSEFYRVIDIIFGGCFN